MTLIPSNSSMRSLGLMLHCVGLVVAVAILAAAAFAHRVTEARIAERRSEQQQAALLLEQAQHLHTARDRSQQRLTRLQAELAALRSFYPKSANETEVLAWLSGLCERTGLELRNFHPGAITAYPTHKELEVRLNCGGAYSGVCRFLAGLKDLPYGYRVMHLNLAAATARGEACELEIQLRLSFALQEPPLP